MEPDDTYKNNLKWYIRQSGYSQEFIAEAIGIGENTMTHYIRGRIPVRDEFREKFAEFFGCSKSQIFPSLPPPESYNKRPSPVPSAEPPVVEGSISLLPASGATQVQSQEIDGQNSETAAWFDIKLQSILSLVSLGYGRVLACSELQALISQEFHMLDRFTSLFTDSNSATSRRNVLLTLVALPSAPALLAALHNQPTAATTEDFVTRSAASITACQHLMKGSEFMIAEQALKQYLPTLETIAQQPSPQQEMALSLAAQGHMMRAILAWHRLDVPGRIMHYKKAIEYSKLTDNLNLQATALTYQGNTYSQIGNYSQARLHYQEALQHELSLSPGIRGYLCVEFALLLARMQQKQEALSYLDTSFHIFPANLKDEPTTQYAEYGPGSLYMVKGQTYVELANPFDAENKPDKGHLDLAWEAYTNINNNPTLIPSERLKVEIANNQAATALAMRDMELFEKYFTEGALGARMLGSQKRYQEAVTNWKRARAIWGDDARLVALAELLM